MYVCVHVCTCERVRARVRARVRLCARVCACVCLWRMYVISGLSILFRIFAKPINLKCLNNC